MCVCVQRSYSLLMVFLHSHNVIMELVNKKSRHSIISQSKRQIWYFSPAYLELSNQEIWSLYMWLNYSWMFSHNGIAIEYRQFIAQLCLSLRRTPRTYLFFALSQIWIVGEYVHWVTKCVINSFYSSQMADFWKFQAVSILTRYNLMIMINI